MSTLVKGLASIKAMQEANAAKAAERDRPKAEWFSSVFPKKTGDTAVIRFLQELDEDMEGFVADRGLGFIAVEHNAPGPEGYKRRGKCTVDSEGQCYACERHKLDYKAGWKQKQNLYINVLMEWEGKPTVFVLSRNANSTFAQSLIQEAIDEGSITNANYRITKTGTGTQTQWLLKRLKGDLLDDSGVEVYDLDSVAIREVEYDKQAEYYGGVSADSSSEGSTASATADDEW